MISPGGTANMDLTEVSRGIQKRKRKKRVGRGIGSGHGKTAGRGMKGQYASAGARLFGRLFEGGQTPLFRRLPKRGFSNARFQKDWAVVNVGDFGKLEPNSRVDMAAFAAAKLVNGTHDGVRVLGDGELTVRGLTVVADHFSKSAREKIEAAGGTCELVPPPKKPVRNKMKKKEPKPAAAPPSA